MVLNRIIVVTLSILLCVSLLGANAALALDRGVLNEDYVKQTAEEQGLYEAVEQEAVDTVRKEAPDTEGLPVDIDVGSLVANALTAEYIQNQSEANIERVYDFLDGEDELDLVLETRPLKENIVDALVEEVRTTDITELAGDGEGADRLANLTASEESYEAERERFRERIKTEIKNSTGIYPEDDFGSERLANLSESEESYEAERKRFRETVKEEIKDEAGIHPEDDFGSERLANLSESEESYEAERESFEEDRKQRIQEETERELSDEELERAYEDKLPEFRDEMRSRLEEEYVTEDTPEPLEEPITDLVNLTVDAMTTDKPYDEFTTEYDAVKEDVDEALDAVVEDNMDEVGDDLRSEIENEMPIPDDAPDYVQSTADDLVDLIVDAYTTDMGYDEFSTEYESVKESFDEDLDRLIEERSDEFVDEFREEVQNELSGSDLPEPFETGLRDSIDLVIRAMTSDMSYDEFTSELESIKVTMAEDGGNYILNEHEGGVPDRIVVTEEMDESELEQLEPAKRAVSTIQLLAWLLPLLSLGLIGGVYGVSRREDTLALVAGVAAVVVGGVSAAAARFVPDEAIGFVELDASNGLVESIEGIVQALFDPLWNQSVVLLVLGVLLIGVGIALRFELGPFGRSEA